MQGWGADDLPLSSTACGGGGPKGRRGRCLLLSGKALVQALPTPKGLIELFVGDLTGQVRFAPHRGRFLQEIWT